MNKSYKYYDMMVYYQRVICVECIGKLGVNYIKCDITTCSITEKELVIWLNKWSVPFKCVTHSAAI